MSGPTITLRRSYLVKSDAIDKIHDAFGEKLVMERKWKDVFYDTNSSSLSNAECILMKDSTSPLYWKFFCYAHNNIMEITTDEQDIHEPLSRLMNFRSKDYISNKLLEPFFSIDNRSGTYNLSPCNLRVTQTDYGFAYCTFEWFELDLTQIINALEFIENTARKLGLSSLALYDAKEYL